MKIPYNTLFPLFRYKRNIIRIKISGLPVNFKNEAIKNEGIPFQRSWKGEWMWERMMFNANYLHDSYIKLTSVARWWLDHSSVTVIGSSVGAVASVLSELDARADPLFDVGTRVIFMPGCFTGGYLRLADPGVFRWRVSAPWHGSNVFPQQWSTSLKIRWKERETESVWVREAMLKFHTWKMKACPELS